MLQAIMSLYNIARVLVCKTSIMYTAVSLVLTSHVKQ